MQVNQARYKARANAVQAVRGAGKKAAASAKGEKPKKKKGWWPFGKKSEAGDAGGDCPGCGKDVDPSWEVCPYCRTPLGAEPGPPTGQPPPPPGGGAPPPMLAGDKTMAIDIEKLAGPQKRLVGWLVVMEGTQKGQDFRLYEGANSIGAAADTDVVITDDYLSARHATIRFEDGTYEMIDAGSTNGSYLNEKKISKEELVDNDTLRLGRTQLRFKALY